MYQSCQYLLMIKDFTINLRVIYHQVNMSELIGQKEVAKDTGKLVLKGWKVQIGCLDDNSVYLNWESY